jgi:hypothetical protein
MTRKQLSNEDLDALVVASLSRLPALGPSRGFADNVMNRVQLPSPRPLVAYRRARGWLAQPRRALAFAGAYAAFATVALIVMVPWLLKHSPAIAFASDWMIGRSAGLLRNAALGLASWTVSSGLTGLLKSVPLSGPQVCFLAFTATAAYAGGAIGLHFLLRAPRDNDAAIQIQA